MKKILCLVAVLTLIVGAAYAADLNDGLTRDVFARNQGRSVTTDNSVLIELWADPGGAEFPGVGVSGTTSLIVYRDYTLQKGYAISTDSSSYDTVGEVVDYINTNFASDSSVKIHAAVGPDGRRSAATTTLKTANILAMTSRREDTTGLVKNRTNDRISAGIDGVANKVNRLKSFTCNFPTVDATGVTYRVYENDTLVWTKTVSTSANNNAANPGNSSNAVTFPEDKGISAKPGASLMVIAVGAENNAGISSGEKANVAISIVYDQF